jgi:hypothetical protein
MLDDIGRRGRHTNMTAPCTWILARKNLSSTGTGRGGRCPYRPLTGPDHVIEQLSSGEVMTIAELQRAAVLLGRHVKSGRMDVLVARFRVAVELERLGA